MPPPPHLPKWKCPQEELLAEVSPMELNGSGGHREGKLGKKAPMLMQEAELGNEEGSS